MIMYLTWCLMPVAAVDSHSLYNYQQIQQLLLRLNNYHSTLQLYSCGHTAFPPDPTPGSFRSTTCEDDG